MTTSKRFPPEKRGGAVVEAPSVPPVAIPGSPPGTTWIEQPEKVEPAKVGEGTYGDGATYEAADPTAYPPPPKEVA